MITVVPAHALDVLGPASPIVGDLDEAVVAAKYLAHVAEDARAYSSSVVAASVASSDLSGDAVTRLRTKMIDVLRPGADSVKSSADDARQGLISYHAATGDIHSRARNLLDGVDEALAKIRIRASDAAFILDQIGVRANYAWNAGLPAVMPASRPLSGGMASDELQSATYLLVDEYGPWWGTVAAEWNHAVTDIEAAGREWQNLIGERAAAERRLLNALQETTLGQLMQVGETGINSMKEVVVFAISGEFRGQAYTEYRPHNAEVDSLFSDCLSQEAFAQAWNSLGLSAEEIEALPIETLAKLACRDELPAWVQNIASTRLLHFAIVDPRSAYELMGLGGPDSISLDTFREQMLSLHGAWRGALVSQDSNVSVVQLIGLGSHDGALTAAISLGDLDTASKVGFNVPGMDSNVGGIGNAVSGAREILNEAIRANGRPSYALVTWFGYRSPVLTEVRGMGRAEAGGVELASFLNGLAYNREINGNTIDVLADLGHSYGSTVSAVALQQLDARVEVDAFVAYGPPGLESGIDAADLRVEQIYSSSAKGDGLAMLGRSLAHPVDPADLPGAIEISAEGDANHRRVNAHDMYFGADSNRVGYLSPGTGTVRDFGRILANGSLK